MDPCLRQFVIKLNYTRICRDDLTLLKHWTEYNALDQVPPPWTSHLHPFSVGRSLSTDSRNTRITEK